MGRAQTQAGIKKRLDRLKQSLLFLNPRKYMESEQRPQGSSCLLACLLSPASRVRHCFHSKKSFYYHLKLLLSQCPQNAFPMTLLKNLFPSVTKVSSTWKLGLGRNEERQSELPGTRTENLPHNLITTWCVAFLKTFGMSVWNLPSLLRLRNLFLQKLKQITLTGRWLRLL